MNGYGTVARVLAGYKAGQISADVAKSMLRELGADDITVALLGAAAGIAGGIIVGDIVGDAVDNIFGDLF